MIKKGKRSQITIFMIIGLMLLLFITSFLYLRERVIGGKIKSIEVEKECLDSDKNASYPLGWNPFVKGVLENNEDYCLNDTYVYEIYCNQYGNPIFDDIPCLDICQDGVCIDRGYCGDGINQTPNSEGINEECDDGNDINEDGCLNNCVSSNCLDSDVDFEHLDGFNIAVAGWNFWGTIVRDYCQPGEDKILVEFYCGEEGNVIFNDTVCPGICQDGVCTFQEEIEDEEDVCIPVCCEEEEKITSGCFDSDGGVNVYVRGECVYTDENGVLWEGKQDVCADATGVRVSGDGVYVWELWCMTDEMREYCKTQVDSADYCENLPDHCFGSGLTPMPYDWWPYFVKDDSHFCPNGCRDGVCIQEDGGEVEESEVVNESEENICIPVCCGEEGNESEVVNESEVPTPCMDSDVDFEHLDGFNLEVAGGFSGTPAMDYCQPGEDKILVEFYCGEEGNVIFNDTVCPGICQDGACIDFAYCGDGVIQTPNSEGINEECDDGNNGDNDGCKNDCSFSDTSCDSILDANIISSIISTIECSDSPSSAIYPEMVTNGDCIITHEIVGSNLGDGVNEYTVWNFDFTGESNYESFINLIEEGNLLGCALITLRLIPKSGMISTDSVRIDGLSNLRFVNSAPFNQISRFYVDMLTTPGHYSSQEILNELNGGAGVLSMFYQDDSIIISSKLELAIAEE